MSESYKQDKNYNPETAKAFAEDMRSFLYSFVDPEDMILVKEAEVFDKILRIKTLVNELNVYRDSYYNESKSIISDYEYDKLFDELTELENETRFILSNSPTQTVGYEVNSKFEKVVHTTPLLSLDKTQDTNEFINFCSKNPVLLMHKLDGLTIKLTYENGELVQACTRGNGEEGDDITLNAKYFENIPLRIPNNNKITLIGEAIITRDDFEKINSELEEKDRFKNPRNLASGSVKQLDTQIVKQRHIKFICWNANDLSTDGTMKTGLDIAKDYGFDVVEYITPIDNLEESVPFVIDTLKSHASSKFIPIDGIVAIYNDITYGESLGKTSHHFNNGFAFKFYDEEESTTLIDIEWSMGKTGDLTPVAIFNPVEIDGTTVTRASLHNVSILQELELGIGDNILVYKANQIIPQVRKNLTKSNNIEIPTTCPVCGGTTTIYENTSSGNTVKVLRCTNSSCTGKLLGQLSHFVSKSAMNIDGLSEATLTKFLTMGIINNVIDIYSLNKHVVMLQGVEGFGITSINKLITAIENSKTTTLDRVLNALSIPGIGTSESKTLADFIDNDSSRIFELGTKDLTVINGFGDKMNIAIHKWFENENNVKTVEALLSILTINKPEPKIINTKFTGLGFVITGKLEKYPNRGALEAVILHNGGTLQSSVTSKTNYLINNDINSNSSKNKKAKELNVPIITEQQFIDMVGEDTTATKDISNAVAGKSTPTTTIKSAKKKLF